MRVVSGTAGGVPLACPRTLDVRPTMDRVRGAIFSSLAEQVPGARVLDLFAGSGSVGIEALSRGAQSAVFVERDRTAVEFIRRNLAKTRLEAAAQVCPLDVFKYLERRGETRFDLILADPPYTSAAQPIDFAARLLLPGAVDAALAEGGIFVLEKSPQHALEFPGGWEIRRQKRYGSTELLFLVRA